MIRTILPVVIYMIAAATTAQTLNVPGLSPDAREPRATCKNIPYSQASCVRVLACVGDAGVYFDGQARGWDAGEVTGEMSDGTGCSGNWISGAMGGTGLSQLTCENDVTVDVIYYSQDSETGTVIGQGRDSTGRFIKVWSGANVLAFLTQSGTPNLPCASGAIPIS